MDKRFIEETFPVKEVSEESAKEKNIRHGHISTLHIWWARRPLASSRATSFAALIPAPKNEREKEEMKKFIVELSKWENSLNFSLINKARELILKANGGKPPRVLDPFAGGGAIPLEALRLGCETYAGDYNPVAVLILKCTLEYPQKYGENLVKDVEKWGKRVLEEAKKELQKFYPPVRVKVSGIEGISEVEGIPVGYIWARTIKCTNPSCGAEIPLMRQFWLAKKDKKKVALFPYVEGKEVKFKIVGDGYEKMPEGFDPSKGTISRATAVCPVCGTVIDPNTVRKQFQQGKAGQRLVAVVYTLPGRKGKFYKIATEEDYKAYQEAEKYLQEKVEELRRKFGFEPIPNEPLPPIGTLGFRIQRYGMTKWSDLFNARQKLALITFVEKVREAYERMLEDGYDEEYAKAVVSYLAFTVDRLVDYNSTLCVWAVAGEFIAHTFGRQALPMIWDYFELQPWSESTGDWNSAQEWVIRVIEHITHFLEGTSFSKVLQLSATNLPFPDSYFDAVFTDPPYYDNVPYSYLSDFFYVWLKRSIGYLYPDLFMTPLTPKSEEIVAYTHDRSWEEAKKYFENMLFKAFKEIYRVLKPGGIAVIVYAHKTTEGWETVINALLDSGLTVTASWPISTEMKARLRARESAALASSIYIVARKIEKKAEAFYPEVKQELKAYLEKKLETLWKEGISGPDFFIAAIGSAIEVFGKYKRVIDYEGNVIRADKLLEDVRKIVTEFAIKQILHNGFAAQISPLTRFYILWRWNYGESKAPFDEARKLASGLGLDLEREWNKGFIKKEKEYIKVLGPHERKLSELEKSTELIDVLHRVLLLWEKGRKQEMVQVLKETGYLKSDVFYRVAQAIAEALPSNSREKKLLEGFLSGKERLISEVRQEGLERWM